jgi:ribosomal protein S18 acetylase RimI-like enzyme
MQIVAFTPENALVFKSVRLRALLESPTAFGSTYAKESQLDDAAWIRRITDWGSVRAGHLAMDGEVPCGMIAVFPDKDDRSRAQLISMWVAPERRKTGVGRLLVDAVKTWAAAQSFRELRLLVTSGNRGAIDFYARNEFSMTGRTEPYPNDPALFELEMLCRLATT